MLGLILMHILCPENTHEEDDLRIERARELIPLTFELAMIRPD